MRLAPARHGASLGRMATIPDNFMDLFSRDKKAFANLATLMPDGSPQVTPVWFDYLDGNIIVNSARGRVKDRNMVKNARVALAISDPDNAYRHIAIRGVVKEVTEEGAVAVIDSLAKKYLGQDKYPWLKNDTRVTYVIEPTSVATMG
jgi:PPOX class probable F420-dependent enzyme